MVFGTAHVRSHAGLDRVAGYPRRVTGATPGLIWRRRDPSYPIGALRSGRRPVHPRLKSHTNGRYRRRNPPFTVTTVNREVAPIPAIRWTVVNPEARARTVLRSRRHQVNIVRPSEIENDIALGLRAAYQHIAVSRGLNRVGPIANGAGDERGFAVVADTGTA